MNYECGLHPRACGLPVYLYGGAGRQRGGVRQIQLSMCKHSSWELRWKWLFSSSEGIFYCPLFLTQNRPLKNIGHSLMALLWPKECFVYAYWQNISVLWHVYPATRINWKRNTSVLAGTRKCSLESSLDTSLKNTDDLRFPSVQISDIQAELKSHLFSKLNALLLQFCSIPLRGNA